MSKTPQEEEFRREAGRFTEIAALPGIYEEALYEAGYSLGDDMAWNGKNPEANRMAYDATMKRVPPNLRGTTEILQHDNTTAVLVYDPAKHEATLAFDSMSQRDNVLVNQDEWDAFRRWPTKHPLGGHVHTGLYGDLVEKTSDGDLVGRISKRLHDYAAHEEDGLAVNFIGFSRGGAVVALAAGELMARNLFDNPKLSLGNIISYGTPAYADAEYIDKFNAKAQELRADHNWAVELRGDIMPTVLTPENTSFFAHYDYGQVGERVYMADDVFFSPDKDELASLRSGAYPDAHYVEKYEEALTPGAHGQPGDDPEPEPDSAPHASASPRHHSRIGHHKR